MMAITFTIILTAIITNTPTVNITIITSHVTFYLGRKPHVQCTKLPLPSACRAESCLLCCQPGPSLSHYLPDYHRLLHDSLADCKLKGDELSIWVSGHSNNSCASLPCPDVTGRCIPSTSLYSSWLEGPLAFILLCLVSQPLCPQVSSSTPFANLPGQRWAESQQLALIGLSSSLHSEACNALGVSDGVIHSRIS